jgi:hypothetical protein
MHKGGCERESPKVVFTTTSEENIYIPFFFSKDKTTGILNITDQQRDAKFGFSTRQNSTSFP